MDVDEESKISLEPVSKGTKIKTVKNQSKPKVTAEESKSVEDITEKSKPKILLPEFGDKEEDEMDCEGGDQEEEEQSESSDGDYSEDENHNIKLKVDNDAPSPDSDSEGGESELSNINLKRSRTPIGIKDIDKEFWRILHSYRPELNQIQLDINAMRDSIKENCKIVAKDANEQLKTLERKMELDIKEQQIYIRTLQSDIEITTKKIKRERTDFGLETQNMGRKIDEMDKHQQYVLRSIKTLSLLCKLGFIYKC